MGAKADRLTLLEKVAGAEAQCVAMIHSMALKVYLGRGATSRRPRFQSCKLACGMYEVEEPSRVRLAEASRVAGEKIVFWTRASRLFLGVAGVILIAGACSAPAKGLASEQSTNAEPVAPQPVNLPPPAPALQKPEVAKAEARADPAPPHNTGKTAPGGAFLMRLSKGFDEATQYQSDYTMEVPWNGSGFARDNIHYGPNGATLVIQKRQMKSLAYAGAELQHTGFFGYGRYEAIVKAPVGSGLVSSFFTHTDDNFGDPHDEIDIEFLGRNTHALHINYFKDGEPAGSYYAPTEFDTSQDFHLYAFEWAPDSIRWFADSKLVHEVHGPAARVPRAAGRVIMNIWSAGPSARDWLGPRKFNDNASVTYRCVSHVPLGKTAPQCSDDFEPPRLKP